MRKKVVIIFISIVFIVLLVLFGFIHLVSIFKFDKNECVGLMPDNVYFNMSPSKLKSIKGHPDSNADYSNISPQISCCYSEEILGVPSKSTYTFHKSFFAKMLYNVIYSIPCSSEEQGKETFKKINEILIQSYKEREDYYNDGIIDNWDTDKTITSKFGTDHGATGIIVEISLNINVVDVSVYMNE